MANEKRMIIETNGVRHYPLNEMDFRIILTLAKYSMRVTETAYELDKHRNGILYRIGKIKRITGLDPMNFYDLCKLVEMAKKENRDKESRN